MASPNTTPYHQLPAPDPGNLNDHYILGEIIDNIAELHDDLHDRYPAIDLDILRSQLINIRNHNVEPKEHLRSFLKVYQKTKVYRDAFAQLDETTKSQIDAFISGEPEERVLRQDAAGENVFHLPPSPPVKHHFKELIDRLLHRHQDHDHENGTLNGLASGAANGAERRPIVAGLPVIYENTERTMIMEVYADKEFQNWGQSVQNWPKYTFVPKKVLGLQNLVKYAKEHKFRVRCGGYRHSWSPSFSQDNQILVSLLNLEEVTTIPDPLSIETEHIDPQNELKTIELAPGTAADAKTTLVRVGVSVTNEQFRRWAVANGKWALPMDVILVE
jgi:hypothetical protein